MIRTLTAIVATAALAASAHAQTDHLQCFKVKDTSHKASYTTAVGGVAPAQGCAIKVPAKIMCVPTAAPQTSPTPPIRTRNAANASAFLCYKVRCRRNVLGAITVTDEFGKRIVKARRSRLLCTPLSETSSDIGSNPPTTTTTTPSSGNATTSSTGNRTSTTFHTSTTVGGGPTTTTTIIPPELECFGPATACGGCGQGACQTLRPNGGLICTYQTQGFCDGACNSTGECPEGRYCVGASGTNGQCCAPCF